MAAVGRWDEPRLGMFFFGELRLDSCRTSRYIRKPRRSVVAHLIRAGWMFCPGSSVGRAAD